MKCPDCGQENLAGEETCQSCNASLAALSLPQPRDGDQRKIMDGTISQIKPRAAISLSTDQTVAEAVEMMRRHKMGCVLLTEGERLLGIFTERDILLEVAGKRDPRLARLADVMNPDSHCLRETDTIAFAFHSMALRNYRHIPIRRSDGSLGVISSRDLLRYLCQ